MQAGDTIVALSSGGLPSGVAVIRLSGPAVEAVLGDMLGSLPVPRKLMLAPIAFDGLVLDQGLVAYFPAPKSFTGESCAELHLHGSRAVVQAVLRRLTGRAGLRLAEAGEFTRRAFENGKLDLTEVEGLGDLIRAETESQRAQALARMAGGLSAKLNAWRETMLDLRAEIEAQLDFSDEGDVGALPDSFDVQLSLLRGDIAAALEGAERGRLVREGFRIALAGPPNAGKSSLLNALSRSDVAIVTDEAGTTRDVREVAMDVAGQLVVLLDMAGLRDTDSVAEAEGVRRARQEIAHADLVLWLVAPDVEDIAAPDTEAPVWRVGTKADAGPGGGELAVSSRTGQGIDELLARLSAFVADRASGEPGLVSRERDRAALGEALAALRDAGDGGLGHELRAEALRRASQALERLLGRMDTEHVLDRLFASFCIGK